VLDFAETTFMDSMGVHAVLAAEAYAGREGVRFVLLPGPPAVQRVFEISGIQTREEAARPCARA
jgi:anti-anti-sigma factor